MNNEERATVEQNLHSVLVQKQAVQQQLMEAELALKELTDAKTAYKILGSVMVQASVEELKAELDKKREASQARLSMLDTQEEKLRTKLHG